MLRRRPFCPAWGDQGAFPPAAYLTRTSVSKTRTPQPTAFWKDISVFSGASWGGVGREIDEYHGSWGGGRPFPGGLPESPRLLDRRHPAFLCGQQEEAALATYHRSPTMPKQSWLGGQLAVFQEAGGVYAQRGHIQGHNCTQVKQQEQHLESCRGDVCELSWQVLCPEGDSTASRPPPCRDLQG